MQNDAQKRNFEQNTSTLSISTTLSGVISQAKSFLLAGCGTLGRRSRNPRVPRASAKGSAAGQ